MKNVDVLLIHPPYHRRAGSGIIPPIGLAYIAACLEQVGMTVEILDCAIDCNSQSPEGLAHFRDYLHRQFSKFSPQYIGIGPTTTPALKSLRVLAEVAKDTFPATPLIYGGPFASMADQFPVFFDLLYATAIVRGEGEIVFPRLIEALEKREIGAPLPGVAWSEYDTPEVALVTDVNALPFPSRHLLDNQRYAPSLRRNVFDSATTTLFLSRGCPYNCNFCVSPLLRGNQIARRTNENLFAEMRDCITRYGIRGFIFYDDCLFLKSNGLNRRVKRFCKELNRQVGPVIWEMEMRCDAVATLTAESLSELYESGCRQINMGIEKASDQSLIGLNKRTTKAEIIRACENVKNIAPDIRLTGTFILGGPNETETDISLVSDFAKELPLDFAHFYPLELYPGTPFFYELNRGRSPVEWAYTMLEDESNYWGEVIYETPDLPAKRLIELAQLAYQRFYQRPEWLESFSRETSPDLRDAGLAVVDRWCKDRFHLQPNAMDESTSRLT